jgi:succinate dehydrogenase / fumarate reductase cytochrome b subunit
MATSVSSAEVAAVPRQGVAPLRAGQGIQFVLRRLHSLSGIVPIGAFLLEHFLSNAFATNGPSAYGNQVKFLTGLPFVEWIEAIFIWIPLAYHALYGFFIWWRGETNVAEYPWMGNWMYTAQRWTGIVAFAYIAYHTWYMRFSGVHLIGNPQFAFAKVQAEFHNPWVVAFYVVGIVAASWHFAYGVWLFAAKWGITAGTLARRRFGYVCFALAVVLIAVGLLTIRAFFTPDWQNEYQKLPEHAITRTVQPPLTAHLR